MTLHSEVDHQCQWCSAKFVPLETFPNCPKCGHKSPVVFKHFVELTLGSASYNVFMYRSFMPPAWISSSVGDYYWYTAFRYLAYCSKALGIAERDLLQQRGLSGIEAQKLTEQFVSNLKLGDHPYMTSAISNYLLDLLVYLDARVSKPHSSYPPTA